MLSPRRTAIFLELCRRPCLASGEVARNLRTSRANVIWHIDRLVKAGFLIKHRQGGRWVYYPKNLLSEKEVPLFSVLANELIQRIYLKVRERPGISHGALSKAVPVNRQDLSWHIRKLVAIGLIEAIQDGRFRRYRSTGLFDEMAKAQSKRTGQFRGNIMKSLREDNTSPAIVKILSSSILIRLQGDGRPSVIEIRTDPFEQVLKSVKRQR